MIAVVRDRWASRRTQGRVSVLAWAISAIAASPAPAALGPPAGAARQPASGQHAEDPWPLAEACFAEARRLRRQGESEEPERLVRRGLSLTRAAFGPVDYRSLMLADELADLLIQSGRYDEAEQVCRQTLDLQQQQDPKHEQEIATFWARYRLAGVCTRTGKVAEARQVLRDALAACTEHTGADSELTLTARAALGRTLYQHGGAGLAEAGTVLNEVAIALRTRRGRDSSITLAAQADLALILADLGQLDQAETTAREAYGLERRRLDDRRFEVSVTAVPLAMVLRQRGRLDEAARVLNEEWGRRRVVRGRVHPEALTVAEQLADVLVGQGRAGEAESIARECLRARSGISWTSHADLAQTRLLLGSCLGAQGHHTEAEALVLDGIAGVLQEGAPTTPPRREALARTVAFYEGWVAAGADKSEQARAWRSRLESAVEEASP